MTADGRPSIICLRRAKLMRCSTGIVLNDEMDDFSSPGQTNSFGFAASPANYIRPGKRPQSSISSSIVEDLHTGALVLATGSAGGSRIITATLQNIYHHLDQGLSAVDTVHAPRWHDQLTNVTYFEIAAPNYGITGVSNATVAFLQAKGYNATYQDTSGSTAHVSIFRNYFYNKC
jgi:gamma-glutamyltranspeptidase / glutathione hydrolase